MQAEHAAFAELLNAPQDEAKAIGRRRFPVPRIVDCDQNGSQVRFRVGAPGLMAGWCGETKEWLQQRPTLLSERSVQGNVLAPPLWLHGPYAKGCEKHVSLACLQDISFTLLLSCLAHVMPAFVRLELVAL